MKTFTVLKIEAGRTFSSEVTLDEAGVPRWASNNRVPPGNLRSLSLVEDPPDWLRRHVHKLLP
jgi:hypothetical protein